MIELYTALIAAHTEVSTLPKDGWNDQASFKYARADTVIREARSLLAKHGLAWIRQRAIVREPKLSPGAIGKRDYVGEVEISGPLIHSSGQSMDITYEVPIVAMSATPHDKAWAASVTFGTGYLLLGILNQDRADGEEINARNDAERPVCQGEHEHIALDNIRLCEELAAADGATREQVWGWALRELPVEYGEDEPPGPKRLYVDEGQRMRALLTRTLEAKRASRVEREPRCTGQLQPVADACRQRMDELAKISSLEPLDIWRRVCVEISAPAVGAGGLPMPEQLPKSFGLRAKDVLASWLEVAREQHNLGGEEPSTVDGTPY